MAIVILEYDETARRDVKATWLPEKAGDPVRVAAARLHEGDTFSLAEGARICCERLCGNDPFPKEFRPGDLVLIGRGPGPEVGRVYGITDKGFVQIESPSDTGHTWVGETPPDRLTKLKRPGTLPKGASVIVAYPSFGAKLRSGTRVSVVWRLTGSEIAIVKDRAGELWAVSAESLLVEV